MPAMAPATTARATGLSPGRSFPLLPGGPIGLTPSKSAPLSGWRTKGRSGRSRKAGPKLHFNEEGVGLENKGVKG
jgi:hypothetical protein